MTNENEQPTTTDDGQAGAEPVAPDAGAVTAAARATPVGLPRADHVTLRLSRRVMLFGGGIATAALLLGGGFALGASLGGDDDHHEARHEERARSHAPERRAAPQQRGFNRRGPGNQMPQQGPNQMPPQQTPNQAPGTRPLRPFQGR